MALTVKPPLSLCLIDRATNFVGVYPLASKTSDDACEALAHFSGGTQVQRFYTDNSAELAKAAKDLAWPHDTSTPGRPATNGVAERPARH